MTPELTTIAIALCGFLCGAAAFRRAGHPPASAACWGLAVAAPIGFGGLSLLTYLLRCLGRPSAPLTATLLLVAAAAAFIGLLTLTKRHPRSQPDEDASPPWKDPRLVLAGLAVLVAIWFFQDLSSFRDRGEWDAHGIWNLNARTIHRTLDGPPDFEPFVIGHTDYPLLVPAAVAGQWDVLGNESDAIPLYTGFFFLISLAAGCFGATRLFTGRGPAAAACAIVVTTPIVIEVAQSQIADVPLALAFMLATTGFLAVVTDRRVPPVITGFCLGLVPWAKNEGQPLALILVASMVVAAAVSPLMRRRLRGAMPRLIAGAFLPVAALVWFKVNHAPANDLVQDMDGRFFEFLTDRERWGASIRAYFVEVLPYSGFANWGIAGAATLLIFSVATFRGRVLRRGAPLLASSILIACLTAWVMVYVLTPSPRGQDWHIQTSLHRLCLQLYPTLVVVGLVCLAGRKGLDRPTTETATTP